MAGIAFPTWAYNQVALNQQPPVIVQVPPSSPPVVVPSYGPFYPSRPPHGRPPPPPWPQPPDTKADGFNCDKDKPTFDSSVGPPDVNLAPCGADQ